MMSACYQEKFKWLYVTSNTNHFLAVHFGRVWVEFYSCLSEVRVGVKVEDSFLTRRVLCFVWSVPAQKRPETGHGPFWS